MKRISYVLATPLYVALPKIASANVITLDGKKLLKMTKKEYEKIMSYGSMDSKKTSRSCINIALEDAGLFDEAKELRDIRFYQKYKDSHETYDDFWKEMYSEFLYIE